MKQTVSAGAKINIPEKTMVFRTSSIRRRIILGTDWWTDCDDVAAVRIACYMAKKGVWDMLGIVINGCMPYSAASLSNFLACDGITVPLGIDPSATDFGGNPPYQKRLAEMQCSAVRKNEDCEHAVRLYRRLLASSPDHSVELMEIGYLQALADTLDSPPDDLSPLTGAELINRKVKFLWCMAGSWERKIGHENNFARNRRSADGAYRLLSRYPGKICFLGYEVGASVIVHPIRENDPLTQAFADHGSANGRSAWDPMLVTLAAACPLLYPEFPSTEQFSAAGYKLIRGWTCVHPDTGENTFRADPHAPHGYVKKLQPDIWYEKQLDALL